MKKERKKERKKEGKLLLIVFAFLGFCAALVSLLSQTFRDKPSVPSSRVSLPTNKWYSFLFCISHCILWSSTRPSKTLKSKKVKLNRKISS